jgi:hypothetical protein
VTGMGGRAGSGASGGGGLVEGGAGPAGGGGESNGGSGGAAGGSTTCPIGCEASPLAVCPSGERLWECGAAYEHQKMLDAGCRDLATAVQRFCCPVESYAGCVTAVACAQVSDQAECDARTDCHSVFTDPHDCKCAELGCCARFSRCADGAQANCDASNVSCEAPTPYCESPAYVVSVTGFCYDGCVKPADCAP